MIVVMLAINVIVIVAFVYGETVILVKHLLAMEDIIKLMNRKANVDQQEKVRSVTNVINLHQFAYGPFPILVIQALVRVDSTQSIYQRVIVNNFDK